MLDSNPPSSSQNLGTLLFVGAHPDDAEFGAGGLMCRWRQLGGRVHILSLTDGCAGHHQMSPDELRQRRAIEAANAADKLAADLTIWPNPDGELTPSIALRKKLIANIRRIHPSLIVTHRPADYHPDHRTTAQLVQDACYLLQVPNIAPETPALPKIPPVIFTADSFSYPVKFRADWIIGVDTVIDDIVDLLDCHISQVYEWLPHTMNIDAATIPGIDTGTDTGTDPKNGDAKIWLKKWYGARPKAIAQKYKADCTYAEAFEVSEYGGAFIAPF